MSYDEIIRNAIRNPTPENAQQVFTDIIIPDPRLEPVLQPIAEQVYLGGTSTEILAEGALDSIFNLTQDIVLDDGVDFIFDNFGERIRDFVLDNMYSIFERTMGLLTGG